MDIYTDEHGDVTIIPSISDMTPPSNHPIAQRNTQKSTAQGKRLEAYDGDFTFDEKLMVLYHGVTFSKSETRKILRAVASSDGYADRSEYEQIEQIIKNKDTFTIYDIIEASTIDGALDSHDIAALTKTLAIATHNQNSPSAQMTKTYSENGVSIKSEASQPQQGIFARLKQATRPYWDSSYERELLFAKTAYAIAYADGDFDDAEKRAVQEFMKDTFNTNDETLAHAFNNIVNTPPKHEEKWKFTPWAGIKSYFKQLINAHSTPKQEEPTLPQPSTFEVLQYKFEDSVNSL